MQNLENEIKTNIFKYVEHPLNLALTCRSWSAIAKTPYAKTEWFLEHYGKEDVLLHATRLGPTFMNTEVEKILITRKIITPINNEYTLNQIAKLSRQTVNDPSINRFFNGSPFI
jgi:hypothetical protein